MSITKTTDKNRHFIENFLFHTFEKEDYVQIVKKLKVVIPGFSVRNYHKVDERILKTIAFNQLKKIKNPKKFLEDYVKDVKDIFSSESLDMFMAEVNLSDNLSSGKQLTLLYLYFPDEFEKKRMAIEDNILNERSPLEGIFEVSFADKVEVLTNNEFKILQEKLTEFLKYKLPLINDISINDIIQKNQLPMIGSGVMLHSWLQDQKELYQGNYDKEDVFAYQKLLIFDILFLYSKLLDEFEEKKKQVFDLEQSLERERNENTINLEVQNNKINELREEVKTLLDEKIKLVEKMKNSDKRIKELEDEILDYMENLESMERKMIALKSKADMSKFKYFFSDESFLFISKVESELFNILFTEDQLFYMRDLEHLKEKIKNNNQKIHFINNVGISSKETFNIDEIYKDTNIIHRFINGQPEKVIRKIIYELEGVLRYEVKGTD